MKGAKITTLAENAVERVRIDEAIKAEIGYEGGDRWPLSLAANSSRHTRSSCGKFSRNRGGGRQSFRAIREAGNDVAAKMLNRRIPSQRARQATEAYVVHLPRLADLKEELYLMKPLSRAVTLRR